ncbi:MAG: hypothetical protein ACFHVJ_08580 [Aestuariibacter sp.]
MSNITPANPTLYLNGDSLYDNANFTNEVELIEIIFGTVLSGKPAGYSPATTSEPSVYRVYSGVTQGQPALSITINSESETIECANFEGLKLPSIFTVNQTPTGQAPNYVFTFNNVSANAYNTGWDTFHFVCQNGRAVDPKISIKRPD